MAQTGRACRCETVRRPRWSSSGMMRTVSARTNPQSFASQCFQRLVRFQSNFGKKISLKRCGSQNKPLFLLILKGLYSGVSPPARGAWIETSRKWPHPSRALVAPRTGGVDRNPHGVTIWSRPPCRPPHGGRGSKHSPRNIKARACMSPPARGAWIETHRGH